MAPGDAGARLPRASRTDEALLLATPYRVVDLADEASVADGVAWWDALTGRSGEGMVVKPLDFVARNGQGRLVQPALKCRGREYLRLIYGPEYTAPEHLERLRARGVGAKRALAAREFALGLEALEWFAARAAAPGARGHLRRAGARERVGGPAPVTGPVAETLACPGDVAAVRPARAGTPHALNGKRTGARSRAPHRPLAGFIT